MAARHFDRILPIAAGIAALAAGLWTSFARLGFTAEGINSLHHGPLMVGGFVGTIIALERAVALGRPWGYAAPFFGAVSAVLLLFSAPLHIAAFFLFLSSLALLVIFGVFLNRQAADFTVIMALGAVVWAVGNFLLFRGWLVPHVVPWWAGFLILTIAGERIEMSRLRPRTPRARRLTNTFVLGFIAALFLTLIDQDLGVRAASAAVLGLTAALAHGDIAWKTRSGTGVARYAAYAILSGYFWLGLSGVLGLLFGQTLGGLYYDAWTHSIFVGFVMVMIMAHAPIILPAVLGIPVKFTPLLYAPVTLLHLSLALRVTADLMLSWHGRQWTGVANVASVLLFMAVLVVSVRRARAGEPAAAPLMKEEVSRP
ncbi:MAG TPA: hypothetical protein VK101_03805 [Limnochordia bacterium]|nr:hypothetical protein [Limnochordia bacterium]